MKKRTVSGPGAESGTILQPSQFALQLLHESRSVDDNPDRFLKLVRSKPRFGSNLLNFSKSISQSAAKGTTSVAEAIESMGGETVANLALFCSLLAQYRNGKCRQFDYQRFWQKSLAVGSGAQALGARLQLSPDLLFTCGVLSHLGELVLATAYPGKYGALLGKGSIGGEKLRMEKELSGFSSQELSWRLLARWRLPGVCIEIIREAGLEGNEQREDRTREIECRIVRLAKLMARIALLELPLSKTFLRAERLAEKLGIPAGGFGRFFDSFISSWQRSTDFFKLPTVHCPRYTQVKTIDDASLEIGSDGQTPLTFLAVDDDPMTLIYLTKMLAGDHRTLLTTDNGDKALEIAIKARPDMLITDWRMPGLNGIDLCKIVRKTKVIQHMYIVMLTCNETDDELVQAFESGADDYVVKPFTPKVLQARISSGERLILYQQTIQRDREIIGRYADRLANANKRLQNMAMTDFLTGLPNRRSALSRLKNLVAEVKRYKEPLSCLLIDIDHFKTINDTYGHDCGDNVLQQLSKLLEETARSYDMVSRWGGEEFLIICARSGPHDASRLAERLRSNVEQYEIHIARGAVIKVTVSIGVATWSPDLKNEDELIKEADTRLYQAKEKGRNRVESSTD